jgi:two-component system KDP operon response regulator KdpE
MARILVVEDQANFRRLLRISFSTHNHLITEAETAEAALEIVKTQDLDLVLVDLGLPDYDGQGLISAIREIAQIPIIVLSARFGTAAKIEALNRGADDYVVKPVGIAELLARIRAALRRRPSPGKLNLIDVGDVRIDVESRKVTKSGGEVHLTVREFDVLKVLANNADRLISHRAIVETAWGPDRADDMTHLRVVINQLRRKLETDPAEPRIIVTEPGLGYRLKMDPVD